MKRIPPYLRRGLRIVVDRLSQEYGFSGKTALHYVLISIEESEGEIIGNSQIHKSLIVDSSKKRLLRRLTAISDEFTIFRREIHSKTQTPTMRRTGKEKPIELLVQTGRRFHDTLFPSSLIRLLRNTHYDYLIFESEEYDIPWEIFHDGETFLGLKYAIGRLPIATRLSSFQFSKEYSKLHFSFLSDPREDLSGARKETKVIVDSLVELKNQGVPLEIETYSGDEITDDLVADLISAPDVGIIHYSGHAEFDEDLKVGRLCLKEQDFLSDEITTLLGAPIVFANACSAARTDERSVVYSGEMVGGFAPRFWSRGATAYIGCLWPVNDETAGNFAISFYNEILKETSLGEALKKARLQSYASENPLDTSWASFVLFGHPLQRLTLKIPAEEIELSQVGVMMMDGRSCYDYVIGEGKIEPMLMAGFLSALISFAKEAAASEGIVKRFELTDTNVIVQNDLKYDLCYAYTVSSNYSDELNNSLSYFLELFVDRYKEDLEKWLGDFNDFYGADELVKKAFSDFL